MSKLMGARPSALLAIHDDYAAWCVDEAVLYYQSLLASGRKLAPRKTKDNSATIAQLMRDGD